MHIETGSYDANPNIGLFCFANDKYCLVPKNFKHKKKFEDVLKVPVYEIRAAGTSLLGVFFNGNDDILLVPEIMFDSELDELNKYKIKYKIIKSELTALGNNLLMDNNTCIINQDFDNSVAEELEKLKLIVKQGKIAELNTIGSLASLNKKGCLVSLEAKEFEAKFLESSFKIPVKKGTINFGSQYIKSGIVCNSNGFIVGESSSGPEIQNADSALGFLED